MAYAAMIKVGIDPDSDRAHRHSILNNFVVSEVSALPGFQKGMWMNDGSGIGTCIVVFDTEEHAMGAIVSLPGGGPQVLSSSIQEVEVQVQVPKHMGAPEQSSGRWPTAARVGPPE